MKPKYKLDVSLEQACKLSPHSVPMVLNQLKSHPLWTPGVQDKELHFYYAWAIDLNNDAEEGLAKPTYVTLTAGKGRIRATLLLTESRIPELIYDHPYGVPLSVINSI